MNVGSRSAAELWTGYEAGKTRRGTGQKGITLPDEKAARTAEFAKNYKKAQEGQGTKKAENESESDSQIIVKSDGSRILVTTLQMGGMKMVSSMEISKPTDLVNTVGAVDDTVSAAEQSGAAAAIEQSGIAAAVETEDSR